MKITKKELQSLIKEEIFRASKKNQLQEELRMIQLEHALLEEGLKDWVVGGIIALSALVGKGQSIDSAIEKLPYEDAKKKEIAAAMQNPEVKDVLRQYGVLDNNIQKQIDRYQDLKKGEIVKFGTPVTTSDEESIKYYFKKGWHLTKVETQEIIRDSAKTPIAPTVVVKNFNFEGDKLFGAGKFELGTVPGIEKMLDSIENTNGSLIRVYVESSTDKQRVSSELSDKLEALGYERGNEGLSEARNNAMRDYLTGLGIDGGLIEQSVLFNQGSGKQDAATPQDPSARYVSVAFEVVFEEFPKEGEAVLPAKEEKLVMTFINSQFQDLTRTCDFPKTKISKPHYNKCPIK